jgi:hypothetical protein
MQWSLRLPICNLCYKNVLLCFLAILVPCVIKNFLDGGRYKGEILFIYRVRLPAGAEGGLVSVGKHTSLGRSKN